VANHDTRDMLRKTGIDYIDIMEKAEFILQSWSAIEQTNPDLTRNKETEPKKHGQDV